MKLSGYNLNEFNEEIIIPFKQNKSKLRIYSIVSVLLFVFSILCIININDKSDMIPVLFSYLLLPMVLIVTTTMCINLVCECRRLKREIFLVEHPDIIEICDDFHFEIHNEHNGQISIKSAHTFECDTTKNALVIFGKVYKNDIKIKSYPFSYRLNDIDLIKKVLRFWIALQPMQNFKNKALKDVINMQSSQKSKLFVDEFVASQFLLPIRLLNEFTITSNIVTIMDIDVEYYIDDEYRINIYTSLEEVPKNVLKDFKNCLLIDFTQLCKLVLIEVEDSFVFKEMMERSVLINPRSDRIQLSKNQIEKMKEIRR